MVVLKRDIDAPKGHGAFWVCKCDCGNIVSVRGDSLRNGKTKSCGKTNKCSERKPKAYIDVTGQRFGKLVALERVEPKTEGQKRSKQAIWKCRCDCGKITYVTSYELRTGNTTSCGCNKGRIAEDLTGKRFGKLTVIKRDYKYGETKWFCKCDCGNTTSVKASSLRSGAIKSCGCKDRDFDDLTGQRFGYLLVLGVDKAASKNKMGIFYKCQCDCGNVVTVYGGHLKAKSTFSCGCAKTSIREFYISKILDRVGIKYKREHWFPDLISDLDGRLRFDFYLPELNTCIEYDGIQHFQSSDFFGGIKTFERTRYNDVLKNRYCEDHNIKLIRIPYTKTDAEIKSIIYNIQESCNDHSLEGNDQAYADNSPTLVS